MKKTNIKLMLCGLFLFTFSSCKKFLDRSPLDSVNAEQFFKSETDLEIYANGFIQRNMPGYATLTYGDQYADYLASMKSTTYLTGAYTSDDQGGWDESSWSELRNVNYFLQNMPKAKSFVDARAYNHYEGVGRFWRAWFYYNKIQEFGDVPWYDKVIESNDEAALKKGRDSRAFVMDKILEDLTFAAANCSKDVKFVTSSTQINKWTALAFKARVCLFEGSYRKYHTELNLTASASQFLREAAAAAEELMNTGPFALHSTGNASQDYRSLFISQNVVTKEVILANVFNATFNRFHAATWDYTSATRGNRWSFTKDFVDTYLMRDGTPFTAVNGYQTKTFTEEFVNRDHRMAQTMVSPGYVKRVTGNLRSTVPNFAVTLTGYQPIKWNLDDDIYENTTNNNNSLSVFRFAEVLLNYAEAKAELGEFGEGEWNRTIKPLRERAGVDGKAPTVADPYLANYYLQQTADKWILEIRRERGIEMALENLRWDDIMRWKLAELLVRPWKGMYLKKDVDYDLNGDNNPDVRAVDRSPNTSGMQFIVLGAGSNSTFTLTEGNSGNLVWNLSREWADYKYLKPIPKVAINRNPNLKQNPDWK